MKAKALFYFRRYLKASERMAKVEQEQMAKEGLSYSERQYRTEKAEKCKDEYETLQWIWDRINELPDS